MNAIFRLLAVFVLALSALGVSPAVAQEGQQEQDSGCIHKDPVDPDACEYEDGQAQPETVQLAGVGPGVEQQGAGVPGTVGYGSIAAPTTGKIQPTLERSLRSNILGAASDPNVPVGSEGVNAVPSLFTQFDVRGAYVAGGVGMRNRGFGTINIANIPPGATIVAAYLWWTILAGAEQPNFKNGKINGTPITGLLVGSGPDPCWEAGSGFNYWADVTSIATARMNGAYNLTNFASGQTNGADPFISGSIGPMAEGASLVILFQKETAPAYPLTRVQFYDGYAMTDGPTLSLTASWGFAARNPVAQVRTTFIGADGQQDTEPGSTFNGVAFTRADWDGTDRQAGANFSSGNLWDTDTANVGRFVQPGNTSATITTTGNPDCVSWSAQVLSIGWDGAADTDGDKLRDGWEANGYDANSDGIIDVDLPLYGASVFRKDLFVEMDYMGAETTCPCHLPLAVDLQRIRNVFASAPFANNPNGVAGINLHLDAGPARGATYNLGGGNLVPHDNDLNPALTEFNTIKAANFNSRRAKIFYYMIWAHGYDGGDSSGNSFALPNDSFVVTLGLWANHGDSNAKVGTFIHEFGHTLGLGHGGNEDKNNKPNYLSVMTYAFQVSGVPRTGTTASYFGYSWADLPDLVETTLNENVGLNSAAANTFRTRWYCPNGVLKTSLGTANGRLNWNCNSLISNPVSADLNFDGVRNRLTGWNDWANLVYGGGAVGLGAEFEGEQAVRPAPDELTYEQYLQLSR